MSKKVLVIDDSQLTRNQVEEHLKNAFDAEVFQAEDGQDGWEKLQAEGGIELVVCDIEMPRMGGVEFVRKVRASEEFMYIPLLVMSTLGQVKERDNALNSGADAFLEKPVTLEALQQLIADLW